MRRLANSVVNRVLADSARCLGERSCQLQAKALCFTPLRFNIDLRGLTVRAIHSAELAKPESTSCFVYPPDGRRVVASRDLPAGTDLWLLNVDRGSASRLTFTGTYHMPIWAPDSKIVMFRSFTTPNVFHKTVDGAANEQRLKLPMVPQTPLDWPSDVRYP